ncbi:uncharacterized protein [Argopecten irradians]|uniref:uncharacterized protein n=1 Tax=Argopecten irradians TaxID=31199 RepID=UPI00371A842B
MVAEAWIKQITEGDRIRLNNPQGVRDLADDVKACVEALRAMDMLEETDSRCRMVKLVSRLPLYIQGRWRKEAQRTVEITGKYPHIVKFTFFLETVAKVLFDPVFGVVEQKMRRDTKSKSKPTKRESTSFSVQSTDKSSKITDKSTDSGSKEYNCFKCSGNHQMSTCKKFLYTTPAKRLDVVKEHKLCFNCLNYSNHSAKFCKQLPKCIIDNCKMRHSRLLHTSFLVKKDGSQKSETQSQHYFNTSPTSGNRIEASSSACEGLENGTSKVSLPIVTVLVRGKGQSDFVRTNALLDPGNNKTFY